MSTNKLLLIDALSLIYRSYYAFISNPRINSKGLNTSAIFGFVNTLNDLLKNYSPTHIAVCFDPMEPSFRTQIYKEYKANRQLMPEDIKLSVPIIKDILDSYGIRYIQISNYEADDIIGTLAKKFSTEANIFIYSTDKDFFQLIDKTVYLIKPLPSSNQVLFFDLDNFTKTYGLDNPTKFIDILALMGDSSDNIPGVKGIGEKKAFALIKDFGSLENLYSNLTSIKSESDKNKLIKDRDNAFLSKELVKIRTDLTLNLTLDDLRIGQPDYVRLNKIFSELEFKRTSEKILKSNEIEFTNNQIEEKKIVNLNPEIIDLEAKYEIKKFEIEVYKARSLAYLLDEKNDIYIILPEQTVIYKISAVLKEIFGIFLKNPDIEIVSYNIKESLKKILVNAIDININCKMTDILLLHSLYNSQINHDFDYIYDTILTNKLQINSNNINNKQLLNRLLNIFTLANSLKDKLKDINLLDFYYKIEAPLIGVLTKMEINGILINSDVLGNLKKIFLEKIKTLEKQIFELSNEEFNISSSKQLGIILFEKLKISDNPKLTKTEQYSTDEEELLKYVDKHPIIEKILDYRKYNKLLNTYIDGLIKLQNPITKRVYTQFNQHITVTGRLSSNNPNLQNIPIRSEDGLLIRRAFEPSEGKVFIDVDYSQIELRVMAHFSNDSNMIKAFRENIDIHTQTAAKIYQVDFSEVTREMRAKAKSANFAMIYGSSAYGLARNLKISLNEAKKLIDNYFIIYPDVKNFMNSIVDFAKKNGYVTTLFGRRRYLPEINSRNNTIRINAEHNAINTTIQGTAAEIIKLAMIEIDKYIAKFSGKVSMLLQVHDELLFECDKDLVDVVLPHIVSFMENVVELKVPLKVDYKIGNNWAEVHE